MNWMWAAFGVVLYNYLVFNIEKDDHDDLGKKFNAKKYFRTRWDNWVWSIIFVPVVVLKGDQLWYYIMQWQEWDWKFYDIFYLTAGVLAEGVYYFIKKLGLMVKALKPKP